MTDCTFNGSCEEEYTKLEKIEQSWNDILTTLYTDSWRNDPNLKDTPRRIAKSMVTERCRNISANIDEEAKKLFSTGFPTNYNGMTVIGPTNISGQCPHHFENVDYSVFVSFVKKQTKSNRVPGLSKIPRLIDLVGTRPILHEDFIEKLADLLNDNIAVEGLGVIVFGRHNCMKCRGIRTNSGVLMSVLRGTYLIDESVKKEFYELVKLKMSLESSIK